MGDGLHFIDIVIFAMIAGFLVYRLRGVLGRRHGEERRRPNPFGQRPAARGAADARGSNDNIVTLPDRGRPPAADDQESPRSLAASLDAIKTADPSFDEKHFLEGATAAFRMVVEAFARGDADTLRPLLDDDVFDDFSTAIRQRERDGESLETRVERIQDATVLEAEIKGRKAQITVKFISDQVNITRNQDGKMIDGDPDRSVEVTDIWTFQRSLRSRDPNWLLVATRTPN